MHMPANQKLSEYNTIHTAHVHVHMYTPLSRPHQWLQHAHSFPPPPPELTTEVHHNEMIISGHDQHEQTSQLSTTVHCKRDGEERGVEGGGDTFGKGSTLADMCQ